MDKIWACKECEYLFTTTDVNEMAEHLRIYHFALYEAAAYEIAYRRIISALMD